MEVPFSVRVAGIECIVESYEVQRYDSLFSSIANRGLRVATGWPADHWLVAITPDGVRVERRWKDGDTIDVEGPFIHHDSPA